ncbi:MAG: YggT family protein [Chloroflexota bacterium]
MEVIAGVLIWVLNLLTYALIGRALLSWFDPGGNWQISRVLADITEPVIAPIRQIVPPIGGMLDLSFIIAIVLINVLQRLLVGAISG